MSLADGVDTGMGENGGGGGVGGEYTRPKTETESRVGPCWWCRERGRLRIRAIGSGWQVVCGACRAASPTGDTERRALVLHNGGPVRLLPRSGGSESYEDEYVGGQWLDEPLVKWGL